MVSRQTNADVQVPGYPSFMNPTLLALRELGGSATNAEILQEVIRALKLPPEITEKLQGRGSRTALAHRLSSSRTYLKSYGVIDNPQPGVWTLTDKGRQTGRVDPYTVVKEYHSRLEERRRGRQAATSDEDTRRPDDTA